MIGRRTDLGDEEDDLEGVDLVGVGRGSLGQLDSRDACTPDVRTAVIRRLCDHLGSLGKIRNR